MNLEEYKQTIRDLLEVVDDETVITRVYISLSLAANNQKPESD